MTKAPAKTLKPAAKEPVTAKVSAKADPKISAAKDKAAKKVEPKPSEASATKAVEGKTGAGKTEGGKTGASKTGGGKTGAGKTGGGKTSSGKTVAKAATVDKPKAGSKPNALQQPLQPSAELAAVVGDGTMARGEVVSKVWVYIKANKLQNPDDGREILADDKLKKVFGKPKVTMFEMNKFLAAHLK